MGAFFKGLKRVEVGLLTLLMLAMVAGDLPHCVEKSYCME